MSAHHPLGLLRCPHDHLPDACTAMESDVLAFGTSRTIEFPLNPPDKPMHGWICCGCGWSAPAALSMAYKVKPQSTWDKIRGKAPRVEARSLGYLDLVCSSCKKLICTSCKRFRFLSREEAMERRLEEGQHCPTQQVDRPPSVKQSTFERSPPLMVRAYINRPLPDLPHQPCVARSNAVRDPNTHKPTPRRARTTPKVQSYPDRPLSVSSWLEAHSKRP